MPIRKVLLLDGDEPVRACLQQGSTWEVVCAASAAEGQSLAEKPDLILLDADRLGANLAGAVAECRAGRGLNRAVLIVLAADPAPVAGVAGVVGKRGDSQEMLRGIRDLFESARFDGQLARLEEIGGADFVREMIDLFLQIAPQRLDDARRGAQVGDMDAVARAVHPLKSSAGNLGADAMQELAEHIEQMAVSRCPDAVAALMPRLEQSYADIKARLEGMRGPKG